MKWFEYGDERISDKEILFAVPSVVIGVGILYLPKSLAQVTVFADGWVSLLIGGLFAILITWLVATLAARFPRESFFSYTSLLVSKPVAIVITFCLSIQFFLFTAYEIRLISDISKQYLFTHTPMEIVALTFLLVVVYAVSGSRAGLFRLNVMFLPIIVFVAILVVVFTLGLFEVDNLFPVFETDVKGHLEGAKESFLSYAGFGILLFYISLVKQPKKAPKMAALGMTIPVVLYIFLYIACIGVFAHSSTSNLLYPIIELAKEVEIPGEFFERFESLFFVIWIMAIFNTTAMAMDVTVFALHSLFKSIPKIKLLLILSPLVYLTCMLPQNIHEVLKFGAFISYYGFVFTVLVPIFLIVIAKLRGVKGNG